MSDEDLLARRAERLARRPPDLAHEPPFATVVVVTIGGHAFGLPTAAVQRIVPAPPITPLATRSRSLLGLAQVRGAVLGVLDLAVHLGRGRCAPRYLAVTSDGPRPFALAVEAVGEVREVTRSDLAPHVAVPSVALGVTRDLVTLVDPARLAAEVDPGTPSRGSFS